MDLIQVIDVFILIVIFIYEVLYSIWHHTCIFIPLLIISSFSLAESHFVTVILVFAINYRYPFTY
jgi:hypothetical protein